MGRLTLTTPEGQQVVELLPENSLGRHPSNTIQLLDKIGSKEHCRVIQRAGSFVLQDLGSLNGTYVNGERVSGERALRHGDEIVLGATRARFEETAGLQQAPAWQSDKPAPNANAPGAHPPGSQQAPRSYQQQPSTAGVAPAPAMQPASVQAATLGSHGQGQPAARQGFTPAGTPLPGSAPGTHPSSQTRVDVSDAGRSIGTQITATEKGFVPYDQLATDPKQLAADYERLRLNHELSREISMTRDLDKLLNQILISMFRFVRADRGVIFLKEKDGELKPGASLRRDGSESSITVSSTILNHVIKERATVLTHDAAMDFAGSKGKSMILNRISSAIVAPLLHNDEILGVIWLDSETLAQFQPKDMEMVTSIGAQAAMFIEINILGQKVKQEIVARERFSRLLSPNVAEKVLSGEMIVKKGGNLVDRCTVFNSDIRGFTRMSDGADPEGIVEMLNDYFEHMVELIFKYEGTLDKFMGDGIMALWGAPVLAEDDALRSVSCAIEQIRTLEFFNKNRVASNQDALSVGIGIHTGPLVAGYIGSSKALSYTVIGDTVNTSARLCGVAEGGQIIVSQETLDDLKGKFAYEEMPPAQLKGKAAPFTMYQILGTHPTVQIPASVRTRQPAR